MYCTQCGSKIDDNFKFCPECGAKTVGVEPQGAPRPESSTGYQYCPEGRPKARLSQEEVERIADDVFWRDPRFTWSNVENIQKRTGLDKNAAKRMVDERIKEVKRGIDKRVCPVCGAQDIVVYRGQNSTTTLSFSEGIYHTQYNSGKVQGECLKCGNKWKIRLV